LVALLVLVQLPVALAVPSLATRMRHQRPLVCVIVGCTAAGFLGVLLSPTHPAALWVILIGLGQGAAFPLSLTFLVLRTHSHRETAQLSTMMQSIGYLIAGLGPLVFGALHAATNSWRGPLIFVLVLFVPELVVGLRAASPGYVDAGG
jgi:CP family cyanate transporter-like MFS transporter